MTDNLELVEDQSSDEVDLAVTQVPTYQRRTESGQVVTVKGYVRTDNSAVADRARNSPGRPSIAASSGRFPGDRALPIWPDAGKGAASKVDKQTVQYEGMEDTGVVDQDLLDKHVPIALEILPNLPQNPSLKKVIGIIKGLSTVSLSWDSPQDPTVIELARGVIRVAGYSYVSKTTGKVVRVNPYTQIRSLISGMGGPTMSAKKGLTPELLDKALPGFQIKEKMFKAKAVTNKSKDRTIELQGLSRKSGVTDSTKLDKLQVDRAFDIPAPKPDEDFVKKAMSALHPLEAVRISKEGSKVTRGNETWTRGADALWYKMPRRNGLGVNDKDLTKKLAGKAGRVELTQGNPIKRSTFPMSKVDYDTLNPRSTNYADAVKYHKALEPTFANLPDGIADSLNGNIEVRSTSASTPKNFTGMTRTSVTKTNGHYPKMVIHPNPEYEDDLMKSLPKQQQQGYSVPSTLHPLETTMARESSKFTETLMNNRAPKDMSDRMYTNLSKAYDKHVKSDTGDYSGFGGRDGWIARMSGERSSEIREDITSNLSMSSLDSHEDFLAEAWTEFVANPEPRPLARELGNAFQKSMEEFSDYMFKNNWVDATEIPEKTYNKTTQPPLSRKISTAIGGEEDFTQVTHLAPRELRSVLLESAKYVDIRDSEGNPTFDAEIQQIGDQAYLGSLSYPLSNSADMPDGVPENYGDIVTRATKARYYDEPEDAFLIGPENRKSYSDFIDQSKALLAIQAIEETLTSEGVQTLRVDPRAGEDSVTYARAGYNFDPLYTDVAEVTSMINDLEDILVNIDQDMKDKYYVMQKDQYSTAVRKVNQWQLQVTADPATWPTPDEIGSLGRTDITEKSFGERVLDNYSWSGAKDLDGAKKGYSLDVNPDGTSKALTIDYLPAKDGEADPPWRNTNPAPKTGPGPSAKWSTDEGSSDIWSPDSLWEPSGDPLAPVSATAINSVAREMQDAKPDSKVGDPLKNLLAEVVQKKFETDKKVSTDVSGTLAEHKISVKSEDGSDIFNLSVTKSDDGVVTWSNVSTSKSRASGILAMQMMDSLEASYKQAGVKEIRQDVAEGDDISGYALAMQGYDWSVAPTREMVETKIRAAIADQINEGRFFQEGMIADSLKNSTTSAVMNLQKDLDARLKKSEDKMISQMNALLEKYDDDPKGPMPIEWAALGKSDAWEIAEALSRAPKETKQALGYGVPKSDEIDFEGPNPFEDKTPDDFSFDSPNPFKATGGSKKPSSSGSGRSKNQEPDDGFSFDGPNPFEGQSSKATADTPTPATAQYDPSKKSREEWEAERAQRKQGTLLQQMTSIDGDGTHDMFAEFVGKQFLTFGAYGMVKTLGGYYKWAADSYQPSARKYSVSFMFMLLRLMPASVGRGAIMAAANQITKKMKSSNPDDWPSKGEIDNVIDMIKDKIPEEKMKDVKMP